MKGTTSMGRMGRGRTHIVCRRCGRHSYNIRKRFCAACGYGKTPRRTD